MPVATMTASECLQDYLAHAGQSGERLIASFTGATHETVRDWKARPPNGSNLVRLFYFFELQGYTPDELQKIPEVARDFGRLMAFRVLSDKDALKIAGYATMTQLHNVLLRGTRPTRDKNHVMAVAVRSNADMLASQLEFFSAHGKFPNPECKSPAELSGTRVSFDEFGDPTGRYIHKGTIEDCFLFLATAEWTDERFFRELADWVGVVWHPTGRGWYVTGKLPRGVLLIKVAYYLEQLGFGVKELRRLTPEVRLFGRMMAFGLLDLNEAVEALGYAEANQNAVLSAILRNQDMAAGHLGRLSRYVSSHKNELIEAVSRFRINPDSKPPLLREVPAVPSPELAVVEGSASQQAPPAPMPEPVSITDDLGPRELIEIAANQVRALNPLLAVLASDHCSAEDRARLRKLAGEGMFNDGGIFDLARYAQALTSEASRKHANGGT